MGRLLDLYAHRREGQPLGADEFVISAEEKMTVQASRLIHPAIAAVPEQAMKVEHKHESRRAVAYIASWDVHRAPVFGRCEESGGGGSFDPPVKQVMTQETYRKARPVFWIADNGSSHRCM